MCSDHSVIRVAVILFVLLLPLYAPAQSASQKVQPLPGKAFSHTDNELIGLWSGEGELIEFRTDGSCRYSGELYPYKLSQGHLVVETPGGNVVFSYQLKAGQLFLTANGQQSVYSRVPVKPAVKPPDAGKRNPPDLVGEWCYVKSSSGSFSGRCIVLRENGTYQFTADESQKGQSQDADSGTWYVEGNRLYYQSTTRGSGSYVLERRNHPVNVGDPMIVLDNEPFVTTSPRPPWR